MENPLIINIRCTCIEEYIRIQELHQEYKRQKKEGDILSIFVGSDEVIKGKYEIVDKLMKKCNQCRKAPAVAFYPKIKTQMTEEEQKLFKEGLDRALTIIGPVPDEETTLPQAVDGGVDAIGNPPLPEANGQPVPQPVLQEDAKLDPDFVFEEEPVPDSLFKKVPEVLTEPDFSQAAPSVLEESDDGWNGEDHNYTC